MLKGEIIIKIGSTNIPNKLRLGNGTIILSSDLILLSEIGKEYIVFRYKNNVIKIYRNLDDNINKEKFREDKIKDFMVLNTKKILMPNDVVYDLDNNAIGYSQDAIFYEKDINNILMDNFLEELNFIDSDIDILDNKYILISDCHADNVMYNGKIYVVDIGKYEISRLTPYYAIVHHNILQFNELIASIIAKSNITEDEYYKIYSYLKRMSYKIGTEKFLDVIEKYANKNMNLKEYTYSLVK